MHPDPDMHLNDEILTPALNAMTDDHAELDRVWTEAQRTVDAAERGKGRPLDTLVQAFEFGYLKLYDRVYPDVTSRLGQYAALCGSGYLAVEHYRRGEDVVTDLFPRIE